MAEPRDIDAIALLKADHRKVEDLFEKFENEKNDRKKAALVEEILTELTVHATVEEEIFYPACQGTVDDDMLDEAHVEHDEAKVLMAELSGGSPDDAFYDAKVKVLSELIKHHVQEEEKRSEGIFAQAKGGDVDLGQLATQMAARKEELLAEIKTSGLPTPKTRSFTGHKLEQGERVEAETTA